MPAASNDRFMCPTDLSPRSEMPSITETTYTLDRLASASWYRPSYYLDDLNTEQRHSGVIRVAPSLAELQGSSLIDPYDGGSGIRDTYINDDSLRQSRPSSRDRFQSKFQLSGDQYMRCDYFEQAHDVADVRTSDLEFAQYGTTMLDIQHHNNAAYYQDPSSTQASYWSTNRISEHFCFQSGGPQERACGLSSYNGYSTIDGSEVDCVRSHHTEDQTNHISPSHQLPQLPHQYNRQSSLLSSCGGGYLVKESDHSALLGYPCATSTSSSLLPSSLITPVASVSPLPRCATLFDTNNNDRTFAPLQPVYHIDPSHTEPSLSSLCYRQPCPTTSQSSLFQPDIPKGIKGESKSDKLWSQSSQHQARSSVIRSGFQAGSMDACSSVYYGINGGNMYPYMNGGSLDYAEDDFTKQMMQNSVIGLNSYNSVYNSTTQGTRYKSAKKDIAGTLNLNTPVSVGGDINLPNSNTVDANNNNSISKINSRPIRRRPLRSSMTTALDQMESKPFPSPFLTKSTTETGKKPRQPRGGWQREQPPKFLSEDDKKQWEKDRRKKDNHNQIERRRRYNINDRIRQLSGLLPPDKRSATTVHTKDSLLNKGTILKSSIEYIQTLQLDQKKLKIVEDQRTQLRVANEEMKQKLAKLEQILRQGGLLPNELITPDVPMKNMDMNGGFRFSQNKDNKFNPERLKINPDELSSCMNEIKGNNDGQFSNKHVPDFIITNCISLKPKA